VNQYKKRSSSDISGIITLIILIIIIKMPDINWGKRISGDKYWPCVDCYTITSSYGRRNTGILGASTNHKGIDIRCPVGTKVVSVLDGQVSHIGYNKYRGYYIKIKHSNGVETIYQHGSPNSFKVFVGEIVKGGQTIMLSGNSGVSSGPHLHFEVLVDGKNVNPKTWLRK